MMVQPTLDAKRATVARAAAVNAAVVRAAHVESFWGWKWNIAMWLVLGAVSMTPVLWPQVLTAQGSYSVSPVSATGVQTAQAQPTRHRPRVSIDVHDSTVKYVLQVLMRQAHLQMVGISDEPVLLHRVSVHIEQADILDAVATVLKGTGLVAEMASSGETVLLHRASPTRKDQTTSATGTVVGRVTDSASGKGVSGVTVAIKGTKLSTLTSESGEFVLRDVPVGTQLVTVKLFGYKPSSRTVTVVDSGRVTVHFVLTPTATVLSGVVTTATGQEQRLRVGNDIAVINVDSVMQVAPVTNVTQLLADRVPGLVVQTTSGNPGAPSRLRLRGVSSISSNNDPIVIVDGVRIYADQSGTATDGNIGNVPGAKSNVGGGRSVGATSGSSGSSNQAYAGPSALDQIDPNSIETIEVMKGPSASALYGSDAANGVILITTKHGHVGPARWTASADLGWSSLQGSWPVNYFRFGSPLGGGVSTICSPYNNANSCVLDSIVAFQALNDPAFSPLGTGGRQDISVGVSGGNGTLTYAFTGTAANQTGYLHLPSAITQNFAETHGFAPPDWMVHPQQYPTWGGMGRLDVQLGNSGATLSFSENLFHSRQQQSSLQGSLATLQSAYLTPMNLASASFIDQYYERAVLSTMTITNAITLQQWTPWSWLPINATLGVNTANIDNYSVTPRDYVLGSTDSLGTYQLSRGTNQDKTLNLSTSPRQRFTQIAIGINVHTSSTSIVSASTGCGGLPLGQTIPSKISAQNSCGYDNQSVYSTATYGWYAQPTFNFGSRLFVSPGIRFDGGSASGKGNTMNIFPKTDVSYLAVDRPTDPLFGVLTLVRPRLAFGISGVQPGPAVALRTFITTQTVTPFDTTGAAGTPLPVITLYGLGNTKLHPERSRELEGGVDLGFGNDRFTLKLTGYNKTRYDAIEAIDVAPSVNRNGCCSQADIARNIGTIRNTGFEAAIETRLLDSRPLGWSVNANWAMTRNRVVSLLPGQLPIVESRQAGTAGIYNERVTPGYPLFGFWAQPVLSYADEDEDGFIEPREIRLADSSVYVGAPYPDFTLALGTNITLLNGRVRINTAGAYISGLTQVNSSANMIQLVANDPNASENAQAAVAAAGSYPVLTGSAIGRIQTVNMLRWTTLSINYIVSPLIARWFRASSMSVALQGSNLGLHTNYHGKDPDVNAFATGNVTADAGQLPQPRTWSLRVRLGD